MPVEVRGRKLRSRDDFVYGAQRANSFFPDDSNTGVPAEWLQVVNRPENLITGDFAFTANGQTLEGKKVLGRVLFGGFQNCTVQFNLIKGGGPSSYPTTLDTGLIVCDNISQSGAVIRQNTLDPYTPGQAGGGATNRTNGIRGHHFKSFRNRIRNVVDAYCLYINGNTTSHLGVEIYGDYADSLAYFSPSPNGAGGQTHSDSRTHNDICQIAQNGGVYVLGARWLATASTQVGSLGVGELASNPYAPSVTGQAVGLTSSTQILQPVVLDGVWLGYGAQSYTFISNGQGAIPDVGHELKNCLFLRNSNPLITKDSVSARRPVLVDPLVTVRSIPTTVNPAGIADTTVELGGSNNRWSDDLTFIPITRRTN